MKVWTYLLLAVVALVNTYMCMLAATNMSAAWLATVAVAMLLTMAMAAVVAILEKLNELIAATKARS